MIIVQQKSSLGRSELKNYHFGCWILHLLITFISETARGRSILLQKCRQEKTIKILAIALILTPYILEMVRDI